LGTRCQLEFVQRAGRNFDRRPALAMNEVRELKSPMGKFIAGNYGH
jgi:hypothetical protein